jgi:hypothetical protein
MQVDALAVNLRPRSMMEAGDLGVRLVQQHARDVWVCFTPVLLVVTLLAVSTVEIAPWLPVTIIFWLKPWMDRTLLFVMSRAVFGERTQLADLWAAQRHVWWSKLIGTLTLRRLSLWRAMTQPVYQLEGQRGAALGKRRRQLMKGKHGSGMALQGAFNQLEMIFITSLVVLGVLLNPSEHGNFLWQWMEAGGPIAESLFSAVGYALVVLVVEPFYVAAGFAMYLNRRVELEAWDIEQEFRRAFQA